jgi:hypothetical protein
MQLLAQARDTLTPDACILGKGAAARSSRSHGSGSDPLAGDDNQQQQQQQQQAWQFCVVQVQHNLLLVLQLLQQWWHDNAHGSLNTAICTNRWVETGHRVRMLLLWCCT